MPINIISCVSLPPATIWSVPINDFAKANVELANEAMDGYYPCCGKSICRGCAYSFCQSGNYGKCPFCNADQENKTDEEDVEEIMKRVEANDAASIYFLADSCYKGLNGIQQDQTKAMELYARAAELGCSEAHHHLAVVYHKEGNLKKAKFHWEAAAMAGHEVARYNLGALDYQTGNLERAMKHWTIATLAGYYEAMHHLRILFEKGYVTRESIDSTLTAYNNSCAEMRSKARDAAIRIKMNIFQTMNNT
jgi:TPR repeat protein